MDTQNIQGGTGLAHFNAFSTAQLLNPPLLPNDQIFDIVIRFRTGPTLIPVVPSTGLTGIRSLSVSIGTTDISVALLSQLNAALASKPFATLAEEYRNGVTRYLEVAEQSRRVETAQDLEWFNEHLSIGRFEPLDSLVKLDHGWSGNLGIANYLYDYIDIPQLSISLALEQLGLRISDLPSTQLSISTNTQHPRGNIWYDVCYQIYDPIPDLLRKINRRVRDLQESLELQRMNYLTPMLNHHVELSGQLTSGFTAQTEVLDGIKRILE